MVFKKIKVKCNLTKAGKSTYYILKNVRLALIKSNEKDLYDEIWNQVKETSSYDEAIVIIKKYVKLVDTSKKRR